MKTFSDFLNSFLVLFLFLIAMKDYAKRLLVLTFFWIFVGFLIYNVIVGNVIVIEQYQDVNYLVYGILIALSLYITWCYGLSPMHIRFSRSILFVIGLSAILLWKSILANNGAQWIYFGDLACVFWVITLIIWPTGLIFTKKITKQKEEKDLEIIEV